jgi:diphosphomevalonate decarboxylase
MPMIIRESNQFHAVCLDTTPAIFYLSEFSRRVIAFVENFNKNSENLIGYTFDAGEHAFIFSPQKILKQVLT